MYHWPEHICRGLQVAQGSLGFVGFRANWRKDDPDRNAGSTLDLSFLSKLKVNRELQLPRDARFVRGGKRWNGGALRTVELVESDDVCMVEKVERLHDEVQPSMLANLEELQHTQIKLHLAGGKKGIPAKT